MKQAGWKLSSRRGCQSPSRWEDHHLKGQGALILGQSSPVGWGGPLHSCVAQHQVWSPRREERLLGGCEPGVKCIGQSGWRGHLIGEGTVAALRGWWHSGTVFKYLSTLRIRRVRFLPVWEGSYKYGKETKLEWMLWYQIWIEEIHVNSWFWEISGYTCKGVY